MLAAFLCFLIQFIKGDDLQKDLKKRRKGSVWNWNISGHFKADDVPTTETISDKAMNINCCCCMNWFCEKHQSDDYDSQGYQELGD